MQCLHGSMVIVETVLDGPKSDYSPVRQEIYLTNLPTFGRMVKRAVGRSGSVDGISLAHVIDGIFTVHVTAEIASSWLTEIAPRWSWTTSIQWNLCSICAVSGGIEYQRNSLFA